MGRRKSVRELELQLEYARARENYVRPPIPAGTTPRRRPKSTYKYSSYLAGTSYVLQASNNAVVRFGGAAALGLEAPDASGAPPRGFRPATINMTIGAANPEYVVSAASGRPYIDYTAGEPGSNTQSTFKAPISTGATQATPALVDTAFESVALSMQPTAGLYGRIWLEPERLPTFLSGTAA